MSDSIKAACQEPAGIRAIQEARRKVIEHIGSTSKELGTIAAQYGKVLSSYQVELQQLDASLARLRPVNQVSDCQAPGQAPNVDPHYYNKY